MDSSIDERKSGLWLTVDSPLSFPLQGSNANEIVLLKCWSDEEENQDEEVEEEKSVSHFQITSEEKFS